MSRSEPVRRPRHVYAVGDEPDPRFSLANERTFLAWVRTSLAFTAAGIAIETFGFPDHVASRVSASLMLLALGAMASAHAWFGWMRSERALRLARPLPAPALAPALAAGGMLVAVVLVVGLVLGSVPT